MEFLTDLWLPILLAAVLVFVASSLSHMALALHKNDFAKLPGEDDVLAGLRAQNVPPGDYVFPCPGSMKEMASPEMQARYEQGPVGFLTVLPSGLPAIGKNLVQWFLYCILIGVFVAYVADLVLPPGEAYLRVFRVTGTVATAVYALGAIPDSIWKGRSWGVTLRFVLDGVVYGLVTAGSFGWLWPDA